MGRQEFLDHLRRALNGNVSPALVQDNLNYYNEYINSEMRRGRSEEEILDALGDPRLIARTIIETNSIEDGPEDVYQYGEFSQDNGEYRQTEYNDASSQYQQNYSGNPYRNEAEGSFYHENRRSQRGNERIYRIPGWVWLVLLVVIVFLVLSLAFSVLSFLAPIIIPIVLVVFLVKLFRDWLN